MSVSAFILNGNTFYSLENKNGMKLDVSPFGAGVVGIYTKDKKGEFKNVSLTPTDLFEYKKSSCYAGATLAPNAGRIADGVLTLPEKVYSLTQNDDTHNLHSGFNSGSFVVWNVDSTDSTADYDSVTFSLVIDDGVDGFPGKRKFVVNYILDNDNCVTIEFNATSDKTTWVNMSNHCYFNLSGDFSESALNHSLRINADKFFLNNSESICQQIADVKGTVFDFTTESIINDKIDDDIQLSYARGYNHTFLLNNSDPAVELIDKESGRRLTITTDYPSLVFYSSGYMNEEKLMNNQKSSPCCALALELQEVPNAVNRDDVPKPLLYPDNEKKNYIKFKFDII